MCELLLVCKLINLNHTFRSSRRRSSEGQYQLRAQKLTMKAFNKLIEYCFALLTLSTATLSTIQSNYSQHIVHSPASIKNILLENFNKFSHDSKPSGGSLELFSAPEGQHDRIEGAQRIQKFLTPVEERSPSPHLPVASLSRRSAIAKPSHKVCLAIEIYHHILFFTIMDVLSSLDKIKSNQINSNLIGSGELQKSLLIYFLLFHSHKICYGQYFGNLKDTRNSQHDCELREENPENGETAIRSARIKFYKVSVWH